MEHNCFAILGLTPGPYSNELITQQFEAQRSKCLESLRSVDDPGAERRLEAVHMAYKLLNDPERQARHLAAVRDGRLNDPHDHLRDLIAAAMEDGLLRYSRRQELIRIGRVLGLNEFQVHLLIAEVQIALPRDREPLTKKEIKLLRQVETTERDDSSRRSRHNLIAAGLLALGLFFSALSWLGF